MPGEERRSAPAAAPLRFAPSAQCAVCRSPDPPLTRRHCDSLSPMATVEQQPAPAAERISVENPATGEVIATVPVASAEEVRAIVTRARAAQPAWEAIGFEGRARVLRRAQKWVVDNSDRIVETIVSETGKTHDDALI